MMPPEEIVDIADHAVRSLIHRNGYFVDQHEYQDMVSSAVVRMLEVRPGAIHDDPRGYLYRTAYHAAFDWLWWWEHGKTHAYCRYTKPPKLVDIDSEDIAERGPEDERRGLTPAQMDRLEGIMLASRRRKGARSAAAARQDAQILDLLVRGYENIGICQELGLPYCCINSYRHRIRQALKRDIHATTD